MAIHKKDIEIGAYYQNESNVFRVDEKDENGYHFGVLIYEGYSTGLKVETHGMLDHLFERGNKIRPCTRVFFEGKLREAIAVIQGKI